MSQETENAAVCQNCGQPIPPGESIVDRDVLLCAQCLIEQAESKIDDTPGRFTFATRSHFFQWRLLLWCVLIACLIVIGYQMPQIRNQVKPDKPLRHGSYFTDADTDRCIKNLWLCSKMLQQGRLPGKDILDPASREPYQVITDKNNVTITCPHPDLYGFKAMQVSRNQPIPELVK